MKTILMALAFAAIVVALTMAGVSMLRERSDDAKSRNMMRALALRVGLSILLFLCILAAWQLGWIQPSGVPIGR